MEEQISNYTSNLKCRISLPEHLFAHSIQGRPLSAWQPLDVHLNAVAEKAADFAQPFSSSDWAWSVGILHDIGKAADEFQAYIRRENHIDDERYDAADLGRVNHSSAGATLAEEWHNTIGRPFGRVLSYLIAGHHAGLPDFESADGGRGALTIRLEEGKINLERIRKCAEEIQGAKGTFSALPTHVKKDNVHFWMRMLFSCLVDADFLDTEQFMQPDQALHRQPNRSLAELKPLLDGHLAEIIAKAPDSPLNKVRHEILNACKDAAQQPSGLFSLSVPTGGGKTLSGMAFALDHAVRHHKQRIIYVIPYTSIIEQTADVLERIFGAENIVEHHSNLDLEKETIRSRLAAENWDAPIVITTNVQFFESLFAARPSRCRKLHNIVDSVVILDEAQLVPPDKISPCVNAINELTRNYGVTLLLSTATQPPLPNLDQPREIIPRELNLYDRLKRTDISIPIVLETRITWKELAVCLQDYEQVLCIVNTRKDCYELFQLMPAGTIHLSALMCGEHRSKIIKLIKERLIQKQPIRVISTQLVEAGVDIDFPVVYRALTGLDSLAQAAGRCNREGRLEKGQVFVFVPPQSSPPGLLRKAESSTKELNSIAGFDPQSPSSYSRYFDLLYSKLNDDGVDFLRKLTPSDPKILDIAFRSVSQKFKLIDDQAQTSVFVRYGNGNELIEDLRTIGPSRTLMRKLQRFTVNIRDRLAHSMRSSGLLEEPWPGFIAQSQFSIYSSEIGLDVFRETFPVEDLIV